MFMYRDFASQAVHGMPPCLDEAKTEDGQALHHTEGPRTQIADTLVPRYPNRDYFKAKVFTVRVHGP